MSCVNKYINEKNYRPSIVVYLTDGEVEPKPILYSNSLVVLSGSGRSDMFEDKVPVTKLTHETR